MAELFVIAVLLLTFYAIGFSLFWDVVRRIDFSLLPMAWEVVIDLEMLRQSGAATINQR